MSSSYYNRDPLFFGYHERVRGVMQHLIFKRQLDPMHPLVISYNHHLDLTTAHAEYVRVLELSPPDPGRDHALRTICFRGTNLNFRYCDRVATSIYQEEQHDVQGNPGWNWQRDRGMEEKDEGRKSWEKVRDEKRKSWEKGENDDN